MAPARAASWHLGNRSAYWRPQEPAHYYIGARQARPRAQDPRSEFTPAGNNHRAVDISSEPASAMQ